MRCHSPRTVGFLADGKTISWSPKSFDKQFATFKLPCGKCLPCRLEYARSIAIRCVHEAKMHETNSFVTLTYNDQSLKSEKLVYADFQKFAKDLRTLRYSTLLEKIFPKVPQKVQRGLFRALPPESRQKHLATIFTPILVTGEYGDKRKRPHWHTLLFNYEAPDLEFKYSNDRGDKVHTSETLSKLWGKGLVESGSVTMHSANYCARYAAKKLVHGKDQDHDLHPIHKRSSKYAIGKNFLEKYWRDIFSHGYILHDAQKMPIPRYYEKWLQKTHPEKYCHYVTQVKAAKMALAAERGEIEETTYWEENLKRNINDGEQITRSQINKIILDERYKRLQQYLKDI